jgi:hypothetical protein
VTWRIWNVLTMIVSSGLTLNVDSDSDSEFVICGFAVFRALPSVYLVHLVFCQFL